MVRRAVAATNDSITDYHDRRGEPWHRPASPVADGAARSQHAADWARRRNCKYSNIMIVLIRLEVKSVKLCQIRCHRRLKQSQQLNQAPHLVRWPRVKCPDAAMAEPDGGHSRGPSGLNIMLSVPHHPRGLLRNIQPTTSGPKRMRVRFIWPVLPRHQHVKCEPMRSRHGGDAQPAVARDQCDADIALSQPRQQFAAARIEPRV